MHKNKNKESLELDRPLLPSVYLPIVIIIIYSGLGYKED